MIKISIICIGKIKDGYIKEGISEFSKRLSKYVNKGVENAVMKETDRIIDTINKRNQSYNILLDLKGKAKTSEEMARNIEKLSLTNSEINFIIGGSNGVNDKLRKIVDFRLNFSSFTFPHQLMRLILIEQIYRWISINKNIKYHK